MQVVAVVVSAAAALTGGMLGLGVIVDGLLGAAAVIGALSVLWQKILKPVLHTTRAAAAAYATLQRLDSRFEDFTDRLTEIHEHGSHLDDRMARLEGTVDALLHQRRR